MPHLRRRDPLCPNCGAKAEWYRVTKQEPQRIYCRVCARPFDHVAAPKVLLLDIETSTVKADVFGTGEQKVRHQQITDDFYITSWAGKLLYSKDIFGASVTPQEAVRRDDKRIMKILHGKIKWMDFVLTFNGDKFDILKINWRFLMHNLPPANRYVSIDLYQKMRAVFRPSSLAMDFILKELGYNGKHHSDMAQWQAASSGDPQALKDRYEYNQNDVWMMEDLYPRVRGWFKTHPNFGAFLDVYQTIDPALRLRKDKAGDDLEYRCPRCMKGILHKSKFTLKYQTPAGYFYSVTTCPHCHCPVRMTERKYKGKVSVK